MLVTICILLIPLIGNLYISGWDWDLFDFISISALIFGTGLAYLLVTNKRANVTYRAAVGIALAVSFLLIWINGAVGIIGNEDNPANLMYFGVLMVEFLGVVIANFKPHKMARALYTTALAQALVPGIAFIIWRPEFSVGVIQVFMLNTLFVMLFVISALLFQRTASIKND